MNPGQSYDNKPGRPRPIAGRLEQDMSGTHAERKLKPSDLLAMAQEARRDAGLYPMNNHGPDEEPKDCTCLRCCCMAQARLWEGLAKKREPVWLPCGPRMEAYIARARRHYRHGKTSPRP
jgi:hypothetical protein